MKIIDSTFLKNPYPAYAALRAQGPIHWSEEFCGGAWLLMNYADVAYVLRDQSFSTQRAGGWANSAGPEARTQLHDFKCIFSRSLLFIDGPQHARLRHVMNAGFKPALLESLRPKVQLIIDELLDDLERRGDPDFIAHFARQLPARVIGELLGVDQSERLDFLAWSDDVAAFIGSPTPSMDIALRAQESLIAMNAYFGRLVPERRHSPRDDLISRLIEAEQRGLIVTSKELLAQCCTLLFAGHETTRNLLGNGLFTLLRHPEQWRRLQSTPALITSTLRELLRFESPVQYTGRRVKVETQLHGRVLKKGQLVIPLIGAANRDPQKFSEPEKLDISRAEGNHLAFGYGPHVCIGATLTYLEAELAFAAVMQRFPDVCLAEQEPEWNPNAVYRSLARLPVHLRDPCQFSGPPNRVASHKQLNH